MARVLVNGITGYVEYSKDETSNIAGVSAYVEFIGTPDTSVNHDVRIAGVAAYVEYTNALIGADSGVNAYLEYYDSLVGAVAGVTGYVEFIGTPDTSTVHDVRIAGITGYVEVLGDLIYEEPEPEPPGDYIFGPQCWIF